MENDYFKLEGSDLGVIAGGTITAAPQGIIIYNPINHLVPNPQMSVIEIYACLPKNGEYYNIDYRAVRQLEVNGTPVWKNRDCFDLRALGIDPTSQIYWGRGDVCLEFRDDLDGVDNLIEQALKVNMGLERIS